MRQTHEILLEAGARIEALAQLTGNAEQHKPFVTELLEAASAALRDQMNGEDEKEKAEQIKIAEMLREKRKGAYKALSQL